MTSQHYTTQHTNVCTKNYVDRFNLIFVHRSSGSILTITKNNFFKVTGGGQYIFSSFGDTLFDRGNQPMVTVINVRISPTHNRVTTTEQPIGFY